MKKSTSLFLGLFFYAFAVQAQQLFFEAYSGYNLTKYDHDIYSKSVGYIPLGFKIAGGHEHVQLGFDYRQHITNPEFELSEPLPVRHEFEETFYGAFLRGNISSLPAYRFGLIGMVGAGYYKPTRQTYLLEDDVIQSELEYDKKVGYNFYLGVSAPIFAQLHWELGYQYNITEREDLGKTEKYKANYHHIHVGLSGNFVFGNTQKRCRRVISSSGKGRR